MFWNILSLILLVISWIFMFVILKSWQMNEDEPASGTWALTFLCSIFFFYRLLEDPHFLQVVLYSAILASLSWVVMWILARIFK